MLAPFFTDFLSCAYENSGNGLQFDNFQCTLKASKDNDDGVDDVFKRSYSHLMVHRGCLGAIFQCNNGTLEIWDMKEHDVKESWIMEFNIPIQMLQEPELVVNPPSKISKLAGIESYF